MRTQKAVNALPKKGGSEQIGVKSPRLQGLSRCKRAFFRRGAATECVSWDFFERKSRRALHGVRGDVEAPPGIEPGVRVLQTPALPLGYGAA